MEDRPTYRELEAQIEQLKSQLQLLDGLKENIETTHSFLQTLFDVIPNPLFYKDTDGIYQQCNDAFSKTILGINKEQIIGKSLYDLAETIPRKNADIYKQQDDALFANPGVQFYETQVKCQDGVSRDYHFYKATYSLHGKVIGLVGVMLDVSDYRKAQAELVQTNKALNDLISIDWLTSLYNRRYFDRALELRIAALRGEAKMFAFALIDVDYFKSYNDSFGHQAGDVALQQLAKALQESMALSSGQAFRLGGEEFGVLFDTDCSNYALEVLLLLQENVAALQLRAGDSTVSEYLTVSIGLLSIKSLAANDNASFLYSEADKQLYKSKQQGRNRITSIDVL